MKIIFLIVVYIFFSYSLTSAITLSQTLILKKDLTKLTEELNSIQRDLDSLKKVLVLFALKNYYFKREFFSLENKEKYLSVREGQKILESLYKNLEKELKNKEKRIKELTLVYKKLEKEKISFKNKTHEKPSEDSKNDFIHPISGKYIKEGRYSIKLKKGLAIRAPLSGIISKIGYKEGNYFMVIEEERCRAFIEGLDKISLAIGDQVKANEIVGESSETTFTFEITCKEK